MGVALGLQSTWLPWVPSFCPGLSFCRLFPVRSPRLSLGPTPPVHQVHVAQELCVRTRGLDKCCAPAPLDKLETPLLRAALLTPGEDLWMALVVEEGVEDSRLDPAVRARLALEDQCPTLALEGVPTLVGRPQVSEGSLATGSLTANLTDSARELQAAVLTLAQTTLKQAGPRVAEARLARRLDTRRSAPAPGITLEILLCPVARSPLRISAGQIRAVPMLIVNLVLTTGPAKIVQCVFVTKGTEGTV